MMSIAPDSWPHSLLYVGVFFPPHVISCCRKWATWCLPSGLVWILSEQGVKPCWNLLDLVIFLLQCRFYLKPHVSDYSNTSLTSCFESTRVHFYPTKTSKIRILFGLIYCDIVIVKMSKYVLKTLVAC